MSGVAIPFVAIVMSLLIPIVAIIFGSIASIREKKNEAELRKTLIENNTDLETTKAILAEQEKKSDKYTSLRAALVLIGVGLGALLDYLLDIHGIYFWLVIAFGIGIGLLTSFFIEMKLQKQNPQEE